MPELLAHYVENEKKEDDIPVPLDQLLEEMEDLGLKYPTSKKLKVVFYPKEQMSTPLLVYISDEDVDWLKDYVLAIGAASHTRWPSFEIGKYTLGYDPGSSIPLGRAIVCKMLGVSKYILEGCKVEPLDAYHLNCRRDNLWVGRGLEKGWKGNRLDKLPEGGGIPYEYLAG